eukprot:41623_1
MCNDLCVIFIWVLQLCLFCHNCYGVTYNCNTAFDAVEECNVTTTITDDLRVFGYKSLFQPSLSLSNTRTRWCWGAYSCTESQLITTQFDIVCGGTSSCSNNLYMSANNDIKALGTNVLSNTNLSFSNILHCDGEQSCSNSIITSSENGSLSVFKKIYIHGSGSFSLSKSIINYDVAGGKMVINFAGYYSGYQTTINCQSFCEVRCYFYGCLELILNCATNSCRMIYISPNALNYPTKKIYNSSAITDSNEKQCSLQTTDKTFDDKDEHYQGSDIYHSDVGPICCRAYTACRDATLIYNNATEPSVVCSGVLSCWFMDISSDSNIIVECSGQSSCNHMQLTNVNGGYMYCYGGNSCAWASVARISNIHCMANLACANTHISSNGLDITVLFAAHQAGLGATIICNRGDYCTILCLAHYSCPDVDLICNGICFVECNEYTKCPNGWTSSPTEFPTDPTTNIPTTDATITNVPTTR